MVSASSSAVATAPIPAAKPSINLNEKLPSEDDLQSLDSPTVAANAAYAATTVELHAATIVPVNDISRRMRRAERFGLPVQLSEEEKRNSRAERFGSVGGADKSDVLNKSEDLKRKARAERFGTPVPSTTTDEEAKKKARSARFSAGTKTDPQEEDKRKLRAIRFSDVPSSLNGKAAIAGKASGVA
ncbi:hypothetical protein MLD38_026486 [Melastoma candidum]|uniref:Uncharacterized protein n=1 Tax=Melastoma candidum TaxID=119954 RepID=A0ACB9P3T6_9MYRT|nr:hypothetical protein MLD38_026486 [Melastoma candidum]